jgi:hypothetical protein
MQALFIGLISFCALSLAAPVLGSSQTTDEYDSVEFELIGITGSIHSYESSGYPRYLDEHEYYNERFASDVSAGTPTWHYTVDKDTLRFSIVRLGTLYNQFRTEEKITVVLANEDTASSLTYAYSHYVPQNHGSMGSSRRIALKNVPLVRWKDGLGAQLDSEMLARHLVSIEDRWGQSAGMENWYWGTEMQSYALASNANFSLSMLRTVKVFGPVSEYLETNVGRAQQRAVQIKNFGLLPANGRYVRLRGGAHFSVEQTSIPKLHTGDSTRLVITFRPSLRGYHNDTLEIFDATGGPLYTLNLTGRANQGRLQFSNYTLDFERVGQEAQTKRIVCYSTGDEPVTITAVEFTGSPNFGLAMIPPFALGTNDKIELVFQHFPYLQDTQVSTATINYSDGYSNASTQLKLVAVVDGASTVRPTEHEVKDKWGLLIHQGNGLPLKFSGAQLGDTIRIVDLMGRVVLEEKMTSSEQTLAHSLECGIYCLLIEGNQGSSSRTLVIQ